MFTSLLDLHFQTACHQPHQNLSHLHLSTYWSQSLTNEPEMNMARTLKIKLMKSSVCANLSSKTAQATEIIKKQPSQWLSKLIINWQSILVSDDQFSLARRMLKKTTQGTVKHHYLSLFFQQSSPVRSFFFLFYHHWYMTCQNSIMRGLWK